ncbi:hypothetical protein L6R53_00595 [Myxococcota bacterium]|nr:hypothetical protein [Myxococcota bacterium]
MIIALLTSAALAAGFHAGIPVQGVSGLGAPTFHDASTGWSAPVLGADGQPLGVARVYVAPTTAAAAAWAEDAARAVQAPLVPLPSFGDAALANAGALVARDGNVAIAVSVSGSDPQGPARSLLAAIVDAPAAWPQAPTLRPVDGGWAIVSPGAVGWTITGGQRPLGQPDTWSELPQEIVAWDAWGRAAVMRP